MKHEMRRRIYSGGPEERRYQALRGCNKILSVNLLCEHRYRYRYRYRSPCVSMCVCVCVRLWSWDENLPNLAFDAESV